MEQWKQGHYSYYLVLNTPYDGLTARFDTAKARLDAVENTIHSKRFRRAAIEAFLATLAEANLVDKFDTPLWCGLVDFVTSTVRTMCGLPSKTGR